MLALSTEQLILLARLASIGKSSMPETTTTLDSRITMIIENMLLLCSNQKSKIDVLNLRHDKTFQLDSQSSFSCKLSQFYARNGLL